MSRRKVALLTLLLLLAAMVLSLLVGELNHPQTEEKVLYPRKMVEVAPVQTEEIQVPELSVVQKKCAEEKLGEREYYDVPLSEEIQDFVFDICEEHNICPSLIIAIMEQESQFDVVAIGDDGKSFGIMQVQPRWHFDRMEKYGVTDLLDPYQNITVAVDYIVELRGMNSELEWVLMAYNKGPGDADELMRNGITLEYATEIMQRLKELEKEREQWD